MYVAVGLRFVPDFWNFDSFENLKFFEVFETVFDNFLSPLLQRFVYCYIHVALVEILFKKGGKQRN